MPEGVGGLSLACGQKGQEDTICLPSSDASHTHPQAARGVPAVGRPLGGPPSWLVPRTHRSQEFQPIPAPTVWPSPAPPPVLLPRPWSGEPAELGGLTPGEAQRLQVIGRREKQGWTQCFFLYLDPKIEPPRPAGGKCPTAPLCFSACTSIAESPPPGVSSSCMGGCFSWLGPWVLPKGPAPKLDPSSSLLSTCRHSAQPSAPLGGCPVAHESVKVLAGCVRSRHCKCWSAGQAGRVSCAWFP